MLPSRPPSPLLASIVSELPVLAYFLLAEALAVVSTWASVALEHYSRSRVLELARDRGDAARVESRLEHTGAYELAARLARFLGNALLAVGIAGAALGSDVAHVTENGIPWGGLATAVGVAFVVIFLVNDVVVRLLARKHPSRALLAVLPVLEILRWVTAPVRVPLVGAAHLLFRVQLQEPESTAREEVLESVEEGEREGSLTSDEAEMIESIIDMDSATAEDVCTPRGEIEMVHESVALDDAARYMVEHGHRRVPVYGKDRDDVLGVVYAFDLLARLTRQDRRRTVREVMRSPFFVPDGKPLNDLLNEMRARRVSLAVVLNEFGATSGVVTIEDVLEEIVGEIEDEHDRSGPPVVVRDGILDVEGRTPIEDVNEALAVSLPVREDFETVGGLMFHQLGRVPKAGDVVTTDGVTLTVVEADERTVKRLRVRALVPPDAE